MRKVFGLFLVATVIEGCSGNPTGPGTGYSGFHAATDSTSYNVQSTVEVTVTNQSSSTGLFASCGGNWKFMVQKSIGGNGIDYNGLDCVAILQTRPSALLSDSSRIVFFPIRALGVSTGLQGTYRFKFSFSVSPDSTLSDSLFSNWFVVR